MSFSGLEQPRQALVALHTIPAVIILWLTGGNGWRLARSGTGRIVHVPTWIANGCWAAH